MAKKLVAYVWHVDGNRWDLFCYNQYELKVSFICLIGLGPANGRAGVMTVVSQRSNYLYTY